MLAVSLMEVDTKWIDKGVDTLPVVILISLADTKFFFFFFKPFYSRAPEQNPG
jgi:hypothetical protein